MKNILYVDLGNVLVDFPSAFPRIEQRLLERYKGRLDDIPGIFARMDPVAGAQEAYRMLSECFDTYILSTAPWNNPSAWSDKLQWVKEYLGQRAYKRLILTHHKHLNEGDYLVDDREKKEAAQFSGERIPFGSTSFPTGQPWCVICALDPNDRWMAARRPARCRQYSIF